MKKLEIEKTKPTCIISTFKTDIINVGLFFLISSFFTDEFSQANNRSVFTCTNSALSPEPAEPWGNCPPRFFSELEIKKKYS